jgi:hypothetical protein
MIAMYDSIFFILRLQHPMSRPVGPIYKLPTVAAQRSFSAEACSKTALFPYSDLEKDASVLSARNLDYTQSVFFRIGKRLEFNRNFTVIAYVRRMEISEIASGAIGN